MRTRYQNQYQSEENCENNQIFNTVSPHLRIDDQRLQMPLVVVAAFAGHIFYYKSGFFIVNIISVKNIYNYSDPRPAGLTAGRIQKISESMTAGSGSHLNKPVCALVYTGSIPIANQHFILCTPILPILSSL